MTGQKAKRQRDGTWRSESAAKVLTELGTQTLGAYIDKRQATVTEWVALRPIIDIYHKETGYEGGGRRQDLWWRKMAARKQLSEMLEEVLATARARRWESGRRGEGRGDREAAESGSGRDGTQYAETDKGDSRMGE